MARHPNQSMASGTPAKPTNLSDRAAESWDKIIKELEESNIQVAPAHRVLIAQAATIAADIQEAWEAIKDGSTYEVNEKTGVTQLHPGAKRLDALRRDLVKVMSLIGLRTPTRGEKSESTLDDILRG